MGDKAAGWVTELRGAHERRHIRCAQVKVARGPDKGKTARIERPRFRVGALPTNELTLSDPAVSGHHFELVLEPDGWRIRDLGSSNGTEVSGLRVVDAWLPEKAKIYAGDTRIDFRIEDGSVELPASESDRFGPLLGQSVAMRELFAELGRVSPTSSTVLITGETGTGKEVVAEAIVEASDRADGPLVVVDCASLAPTLVESELFGHEKGAFTGATEAKAGAFERADGGTVLLDEIGELPQALQPRLLRVLERHEVKRLGGAQPKKVDIRVLAATHRSLEQAVNRGDFRADLFYRLSVLSVHVPALRQRVSDIPLLAEHFLSHLPGADPAVLDAATIKRLQSHSWPGNVRELRNAVERLALGSDPIARPSQTRGEPSSADAIDLDIPFREQKDRLIERFEHRYAEALKAHSPDNVSKAARKAGLDRMAVVKLYRRHGLD